MSQEVSQVDAVPDAVPDAGPEALPDEIPKNEEFNGRTDECFILQFLRICKFDVTKTKARILRYYEVLNKEWKWLEMTDETEAIDDALINQHVTFGMFFEGSCKEFIHIAKLGNLDATGFRVEQFLHCMSQIDLTISENPRIQTAGVIYIVDFQAISFYTITQFTPRLVWRSANFWQKSMPIKIAGIHYINVSPIVYHLANIVKTLLSKKLKERGDKESIFDFIPRECLPNEYGGTAGPVQKFAEKTLADYYNNKEQQLEYRKFGLRKTRTTEVDLST